MPRKPKLSPEQIEQVRDLRSQGLTQVKIAARLGVRQQVVSGALRRARGPAAGHRARSPEAPPAETVGEVSGGIGDATPQGEEVGIDELREMSASKLRRLSTEIDAALADGRVDAAMSLVRVWNQTAANVAKTMAPSPPTPAEERPDMQAAADRARRKLWEVVEVARLGKSEGRGRARPSSGASNSCERPSTAASVDDQVSGDEVRAALDAALERLTTVELAGLAYDWEEWWARPEQIPPAGNWRSCGWCTGRGWGKTRSVSEHVHKEAMSGRAMRICLIAQDEDSAYDIQVRGDSGLLSVAPPWEMPVLEGDELHWPNGAIAQVRTPQAPGKIRGPGFHLVWMTEIVAWPQTKRDEALSNLRRTTRLGYAHTLWDTTPKRRHPLIRALLDRSRLAPERHVVVHGSTRDNVANINPDELDDWETELEGTVRGREELHGEYVDESEGALVRQEWIDAHRRALPHRLARRIIAIDPAYSMRRSTDATGMSEQGLGLDGQIHIIDDLSGNMPWEEWARVAVTHYMQGKCDCMVIERAYGGDANVANVRSYCRLQRPPIDVQVVKADAHTRHDPGVVYIKEVLVRDGKIERLGPVAPLYEKGRISHLEGADLTDLEDELTTWEPDAGMRSPNRMDAAVHGVWELADLARDVRQARPTAGLDKVRERLMRPLVARPSAGNPLAGAILPRHVGRSSRL